MTAIDPTELVDAAAADLLAIDPPAPSVETWLASMPEAVSPVGTAVPTTSAEVDDLDDDEGSSFEAVDLDAVLAGNYTQPQPTYLRRHDGGHLFYAGKVNGLHGDSGTGKSWVAVLTAAQVIRGGERVLVIDLEDDAASWVARLRLVGLTDEQIRRGLDYRRPVEPFTPANVGRLLAAIRDQGHGLVVLDSVGEAFSLDGVNEDKDNEVGPWIRRVLRPMAEAGPAVVMIDHSTKAADAPLHPSGSKRKRAAITGASYLVQATTPLVKGKGGRLRLTTAKDRHGNYGRGQVAANLVMRPTDAGVVVDLYAPDDEATTGNQDPALLIVAAQVVRLVRESTTPLSKTTVRELLTVKARTDTKRAAVDFAVSCGSLAVEKGARGAHHLVYVRDLQQGDAPS